MRTGVAFTGTEQLTVLGKQLHAGDAAPDLRFEYLDLADLAIRTISLADTAGIVRLRSVVNSLERQVCRCVTRLRVSRSGCTNSQAGVFHELRTTYRDCTKRAY
jgi:peroxiredoxin